MKIRAFKRLEKKKKLSSPDSHHLSHIRELDQPSTSWAISAFLFVRCSLSNQAGYSSQAEAEGFLSSHAPRCLEEELCSTWAGYKNWQRFAGACFMPSQELTLLRAWLHCCGPSLNQSVVTFLVPTPKVFVIQVTVKKGCKPQFKANV